jgi:hypothetical protein
VLICFRDDMLDRLLKAYGDVSDYTWSEMQQFRFCRARLAPSAAFPRSSKCFSFTGNMGGDAPRYKTDAAISDLLSRMDMLDQVAYCDMENCGVILRESRLPLGIAF